MSESLPLSLAAMIFLGIACQWLAWKIKLPAILLLLTAGLLAGPGTAWAAHQGWVHHQWIDPEKVFGKLLLPIASLSVALILFEGGLTLDARELREGGGSVLRMVTLAALLTFGLTTLAARFVLGFQSGLAMLLGAILVVTGPTVIGPLLRFVRPTGLVSPILRWEGIIIDPVGALLAVIVFEVVAGGENPSATMVLESIGKTLAVGAFIGLAGAGLLMLLLRRNGAPDTLHNPLSVAVVLGAFAGSNYVQHESGLAAVTVMGIVMANQRRVIIEHVLEFKEALSVLLISSLFVMLSARLTLDQLQAIDWRVLVFIGLLILVVRPVSVAMAMVRSPLKWRERAFLAAMAPRGIVAASVASVFALRLIDQHYPQADRLVPVTFAVVAGTVLVYGLGSPLISYRLGLSKRGQSGLLIIGADRVAREIAAAIQREGFDVLLVDSNQRHAAAARLASLPTMHADALSNAVGNAVSLSSIGRVLALTPNHEVNALVTVKHGRQFGRNNIYRLPDSVSTHQPPGKKDESNDGHLFSASLTHQRFDELLDAGATIKSTRLSEAFDYAKYVELYRERAMPLFIINDKRELAAVESRQAAAPKAGETVISLVEAGPPPALATI